MVRPDEDEELNEIVKAAEREFPEDPALQQIHIARGILSKEAKKAGLSYAEFIRAESRKTEEEKRIA